MTFATKLRELRTAKEWSQKDLAQRAGVGQSAIARWEAGTQIPGVNLFQDLCAALGVKCTVFDGCDYEADETARPRGRPKKEGDAEPKPVKPAGKRRKGKGA